MKFFFSVAAASASRFQNSLDAVAKPEYVSPSNEGDDFPVRWKAPESLKDKRWSTASDVWAFGVLIYEVLTYGCIPYRHILDDEEVVSLVSTLNIP